MSTSEIALTRRSTRFGSITPGDFITGATDITAAGEILSSAGRGQAKIATVAELLTKLTGAATLAAGAMLYGAGTATPSTLTLGTAGQVLVAGASAPAWTDTFTTAKTIDLGTGALPAVINGTAFLRTSMADATIPQWEVLSYGANGLNLRGRPIGGTRASPTATTDGQRFFQFSGHGYDGSAWSTAPSGYWILAADGLWSGTNRGVYQYWAGTPNGSTAAAVWMTLQNAALGIGAAPTTGNGLLQLASGTTKANGIAFGTDTFLYRSAAGILQSDGGAAFGPSAVGYSGAFALSSTAGNWSTFYTERSGVVRWAFGMNGDAESSGNAGSNFNVRAYTDAGGLLGDALIIRRSTLEVGLSAAPTTGNGLLQLASGTTRANGIAFGADVFFYRTSAGSVNFTSDSGAAQFYTYDSTGTYAAQLYASASNVVIGGVGNTQVLIRSNSATAITIDTSQNATFAQAVTVSNKLLVNGGSSSGIYAIDSYGSRTLGSALTNGSTGGIRSSATYSGAYAVTRHNYLIFLNPTLNSGATLTDAAVIEFDAAAGTHKAVDSGTTKTTPGTVDAWVKINVNGTIHYLPAYTSKTA